MCNGDYRRRFYHIKGLVFKRKHLSGNATPSIKNRFDTSVMAQHRMMADGIILDVATVKKKKRTKSCQRLVE